MTRTTPLLQPRQSNHGQKRKGKPVESWMLELEKAQDEENCGSQSLDFSAIEQIADGVEQMVFSWGLQKQERGRDECAEFSKSSAKENNSPQVLFPWSLHKNEELGLDFTSENISVAMNNKTFATTTTQPQGTLLGTKRTSPNCVLQLKQQGNKRLDDFGNVKDLPTMVSENPQLLNTENPLQPCCGILTSSNRMQNCTTSKRGIVLHGLENVAQEEVGLDSTSEGDMADRNNEPLATTRQFQGTVIGTKRTSPKRIQLKQSPKGWLNNVDNEKDLPEIIFKNSQLVNLGNSPQPHHGELTSSTRVPNCNSPNHREKTLDDFENRAVEDSTCVTMMSEEESVCESIELEIGKDNCISRNVCIPSKKCCSNTSRKKNIIKNNPFIGSLHLLSQSPLCSQLPSPRFETTHSNEAMANESPTNEHFATNLTELPLCSPIDENEREGAAPLLPYLDASPCCGEDTESVEVGGHTINVTTLRGANDILEHKFQALVNINACALGIQEEHQLKTSPTTDVEDLQIALLECAMEYEIKTIEAKMKMQELKLRGQQNVVVAKSKHPCPQRTIELAPSSGEKVMDNQRVQQLKKQMAKLQHEKDTLNNELHVMRDKERQFERQKRSLEDALLRVNRLQREVAKKEQEVVEWQLKDKETKAQLQEVGEKLKRQQYGQVSMPLEPKKLLTLLPALREWLRSLKKVGLAKVAERRHFHDKEDGDYVYPHMDGYNMQPNALHSRDKGMPVVEAHSSLLGQLSEELAHQSNHALNVHQVDMVICCLTKEIHALQKELSKLARS